MEYHQLGTSDLHVSTLSFGCMSLKGTPSENTTLLRQALAGGINFFDTADLYDQGGNEETVGKAFKGVRDQVILATKVGNQWRPDGSGWDWNPGKAYILQAVEQSLRRLQTDYIDLYQLHGGTLEDPIEETIEAFELLQQQGKIRYYGISSIRPNVIREYVRRANLVSVMMQYSLLDRRPEEEVLDLLQQHQISVLARGSLAQGLLLGKPAKAYLDLSAGQVAKMASAVQALATQDASELALAVQYVLQAPAVATAVLGVRTREQLAQLLAAARAAPLAPQQVAMLQQLLPAATYAQHR
ncbi:aldo/keto reductase [Rufibacter quisquiliarum]|uniref:Aryl-alcohol dehydrogenase-like predicted oxidoreductase n=1 Tax=Rufibacter quisquiliarum TaxID=1549639 RepID=A0A839GLT8_9BACT|nr:aldo/keto reductase [Rufibacter quisquiliarum]MBA9078793.1 aryl-alcohol dehydrogenase-like predicted oxidoreductase [Rufibacter quisquiliarum]